MLLEPMTIMFASKGYKLDDVIQEVRRMQTQWQHSDYRAWLKHYTTGKRPRSAMEDTKQLLRRDGGDNGAGPRDMGTGWLPASKPPDLRVCILPTSCVLSAHCTLCCPGGRLRCFPYACIRLFVALACCV